MKQSKALLAMLCAALGSLTANVHAEVLPAVSLNAASPSFLAQGAQQTPNAWVYVGDPDVWQFDLSSFTKPVRVQIAVSDNFPAVPDDYDLSWDGTTFGNSFNHGAAGVVAGAGTGNVFSFVTTAGLHSLGIDYVNRFTGLAPDNDGTGTDIGSWYNLSVSVAAVPEPSTYALMLAGLAMVGLSVRSKLRQ